MFTVLVKSISMYVAEIWGWNEKARPNVDKKKIPNVDPGAPLKNMTNYIAEEIDSEVWK